MTKDNQKNAPQNVSDLMVAGASAILSVIPLTAPIGAAGSFGLLVWQREQQQKFVDEWRQKFDALDKSKLDHSALESDEFKSLVIQAVESASKTASNLKRQALASALVSSIVLPTSRFTGKQALLRLLEQLSDEEMVALKVLYDEEPPLEERRPKSAIPAGELLRVRLGMSEADVAARFEWSKDDALVACQGLRQLGLAHEPDPDLGAILTEDAPPKRGWRVTALAEKLIKWCGEV
jgi:hypothetical protein